MLILISILCLLGRRPVCFTFHWPLLPFAAVNRFPHLPHSLTAPSSFFIIFSIFFHHLSRRPFQAGTGFHPIHVRLTHHTFTTSSTSIAAFLVLITVTVCCLSSANLSSPLCLHLCFHHFLFFPHLFLFCLRSMLARFTLSSYTFTFASIRSACLNITLAITFSLPRHRLPPNHLTLCAYISSSSSVATNAAAGLDALSALLARPQFAASLFVFRFGYLDQSVYCNRMQRYALAHKHNLMHTFSLGDTIFLS